MRSHAKRKGPRAPSLRTTGQQPTHTPGDADAALPSGALCHLSSSNHDRSFAAASSSSVGAHSQPPTQGQSPGLSPTECARRQIHASPVGVGSARCRDRHNGRGLVGRRKKKYEGELITFERFETIYNAQGGVCVETGVPFDWASKDLMPSPDRIDNAVGYLDGNIRFVTWRINRMRGGLSVEDFHTTCTQLPHHNNGSSTLRVRY